MARSKVSMKLLIDTKGKRVLFAEAGKDCVDFLFYLLSLPVASVIGLLREEGMEGSLPNLYKSLENLDNTYIEADKKKDIFLKPVAPVSSSSVPLLALKDAPTAVNDSYKCNHCGYGYSSTYQCSCPGCGNRMTKNVQASSSENGGLVKGVVPYMVMDNLEVKPMSTISSITLLNSFNVKNVGALEEKVVTMRMKEAMKLLKTSLESTNVLTDLFC